MHQAVIINNLEEAKLLLKQGQNITLPENACNYMGLPYIEALLAGCEHKFPDIYDRFILDITANPTLLSAVLRGKIKNIRFTGEQNIFAKLVTMANKFPVNLLQEENK